MIQLASDAGNAAGLVFFLLDLLHLDGVDLAVERNPHTRQSKSNLGADQRRQRRSLRQGAGPLLACRDHSTRKRRADVGLQRREDQRR
jgi:hypothetical protein